MAKLLEYNRVVLGQGAGKDPKAIAGGAAGTVLTQVTLGAEPVFAAPAAVSLTTGVSGILPLANGGTGGTAVNLATGITGTLPVANGGTGQTVGAIALMEFSSAGAAVLANTTTYLGHAANGTEALISFPCPVAGTVVMFAVAASTAPVGSETFGYRLILAAGVAGTGITLTGAAVAGTQVQSFAVTLGQTLSCRLVTSLTAVATAAHRATLAIRVDG